MTQPDTGRATKMRFNLRSQGGFTLLELIVVAVITGIIGGMVAMFIQAPMQGYLDSARRAEMSDIADTALRRLAHDIRTALPNSVRIPAGVSTYIEFLPTKDTGRYRALMGPAASIHCGGGTALDVLSFNAPNDPCFAILGPQITFLAGDQIVIGSTQSNGMPPYQLPTSATGIRRAHSDASLGAQPMVVLADTQQLPAFAEVKSGRFDVVSLDQQAVTYACETAVPAAASGDGPLVLRRYWGYGFNEIQVAPPLLAGTNAILADKVSDCNIVYDTVNQLHGLVVIRLGIKRGDESIILYHQVHVNNVP